MFIHAICIHLFFDVFRTRKAIVNEIVGKYARRKMFIHCTLISDVKNYFCLCTSCHWNSISLQRFFFLLEHLSFAKTLSYGYLSFRQIFICKKWWAMLLRAAWNGSSSVSTPQLSYKNSLSSFKFFFICLECHFRVFQHRLTVFSFSYISYTNILYHVNQNAKNVIYYKKGITKSNKTKTIL